MKKQRLYFLLKAKIESKGYKITVKKWRIYAIKKVKRVSG